MCSLPTTAAAGTPRLRSGKVHAKILVFDSAAGLARAAAESFAAAAEAAITGRGRFAVALAGGSTPRPVYELLASEPYRSRIEWRRVHLFWGDERCVPPAHPRSNFRMARRAFISRVPVPPRNVHRIRGELGSKAAAAEYEHELHEFCDGEAPCFDLVHLGLGDDGHTASLFPFDLPVLHERERRVCPVIHLPGGEPRVTLTLPVLNAAACVEFLVAGAAKAPMVRSATEGPLDPFRIPAQLIRPVGEFRWLLDAAAARNLAPERRTQIASPSPARGKVEGSGPRPAE